MKIFLSYGHDENYELVKRIRADLEKNGHDCWIDADRIKGGDDWRRSITDGILNIPDNRQLRFYAAIDVEDAAIEPQHISNMMGAGLRTMARCLPQFMAICFGGKTAEEALEIEPE